jgi:hypothetical protein
VSDVTAQRVAGTVLSEHRTSMGLVRYRRSEGSITVELLPTDQPAAILAMLPAAPRSATGPTPRPMPENGQG